MSLKYLYIVARIRNAKETLAVKSNDPKDVARYIDDYGLYNVLLGTSPDEGIKMVLVGTGGKEDNNMCLMIGATVPVDYKIDYSAIVKRFDDVMSPINSESMFWSHNATYVILETNNHQNISTCDSQVDSQVEWWTYIIKEMKHSYQIEMW